MSIFDLGRVPCAAECGSTITVRSEKLCGVCKEKFCIDCAVQCPSCTYLYDNYHGSQKCKGWLCEECCYADNSTCTCCGVKSACVGSGHYNKSRCMACQYCSTAPYYYDYHGTDADVEKAKKIYS